MPKKVFFASQFLLFLGLVAMVLAGCGSKGPGSPQLASKQVITIANIGTQDIKTMDPALPTDLNSAQALYLAYDGLVTLDAKTLAVKPDIASGWEVSNGGLTYTFHLRSGIKFSNGDPVTAQDFAYSIDRSLQPATQSQVALTYLGHIAGAADLYNGTNNVKTIIGTGVKVIDPLTLQINLDQPVGFFLEALTYSTSWAIDQKIVNQFGANWSDQHSAGTGPFMLQSWKHNVGLTFVKNPNWYGPPTHITEVDMPMFADTGPAFKAFQAKQIDVDNFFGSADYQTAKNGGASKQWQFSETGALWINYVSPNNTIAPFDKLAVRQAFAMAIDRNKISNVTLQGFTAPSDHIVPKGMPGYDANLKETPFDPVKAKQLLQSVYPDVSQMPAVTLEYPNTTDSTKVAQELQSEYQQFLGVHINLNGVDFEKAVNDQLTNKDQFYMIAWIADYPDPQDWTSLQFVTGVPYNNMNYSNTTVDQLCNQADVAQDQNQRFSLYNQVEQTVINEGGWIPFSQQKNVYTSQNWVHGYLLDAGGLTPQANWGDIYILAH